MDISVSSWSFSRPVRDGAMEQVDVPGVVANLGFDSIEFAKFLVPDTVDQVTFAKEARARCDDLGLRVVAYAIAADFIHGSAGDLNAEVDRLKTELEIASILGAPLMRHDVARAPARDGETGRASFDSVLSRLAEGVRRVTENAAAMGIRTCTENHGTFVQDADRVEKLINAVGHPNYGALLDIGNFVCVDEDPAQSAGVMVPYIFHVHGKDFHLRSGERPDPGEGWGTTRGGNRFRGCIVGHGDVPVRQVLGRVKASGYDGTISIEYEGHEPPQIGVAESRDNLRRYWDSLP